MTVKKDRDTMLAIRIKLRRPFKKKAMLIWGRIIAPLILLCSCSNVFPIQQDHNTTGVSYKHSSLSNDQFIVEEVHYAGILAGCVAVMSESNDPIFISNFIDNTAQISIFLPRHTDVKIASVNIFVRSAGQAQKIDALANGNLVIFDITHHWIQLGLKNGFSVNGKKISAKEFSALYGISSKCIKSARP